MNIDTALVSLQGDLDRYVPQPFDREKRKEELNNLRVFNELNAGLSYNHFSPQSLIFWSGYTFGFVQPKELYTVIDRQTGEVKLKNSPDRPFVVKSNLSRVTQPKMTFWSEGQMVKVERLRVKPERKNYEPFEGDWIRGEIKGFSKASKRRLLQKIAATDIECIPLFVTLTYPDCFATDPRIWKRDIDVFGKRFRREFGEGAFIWRLEMKERLSGYNKGQIAPHFHLLVWKVNFYDLLCWCGRAWYEVVGSGNELHLRAGTRVEWLRSFRGAMFYAAKYIAKEIEESFDGWVGRFWGVIGSDNIPWSMIEEVSLTDKDAATFLRILRKWRGLGGRKMYSITCFCDPRQWFRLLELRE